ncbi:MAG: T9SS type A sorting domain-containing protein [Candidatus Stygibacter australis]|nr:T9SS type A sorting domain-containing protein [Candidatus Stygibacter australis]
MKQIIISFLLLITFGIGAVTINVPQDYETIQEGIGASSDGDTVLVTPGTYLENINFNGKAITVGSWFITTQDTSYISQTVIDGGGIDSVVKFVNEEDSLSVLTGFTIRNGFAAYLGGGVSCNSSSPCLNMLKIENNQADEGGGVGCLAEGNPQMHGLLISDNISYHAGGGIYIGYSCSAIINNTKTIRNTAQVGGGVYIYSFSGTTYLDSVEIRDNETINGGGIKVSHSTAVINNSIIIGNCASYKGGGIYLESANTQILNTIIRNNISDLGGGIASNYSDLDLANVDIRYNEATYNGGGIYLESANTQILNTIIRNNSSDLGGGIASDFGDLDLTEVDIKFNDASSYGGGIYSENTQILMSGLSISGNSALSGGGIYCSEDELIFSNESRCSIYLNNCGRRIGADMYLDCESLYTVVLDTFTVIAPTDYHVFSYNPLEYSIEHVMQEQISADLFVSPFGDNANDGLSIASPLLTIHYACSTILADAGNPRTINLMQGIYSSTTNNEYFPVQLPLYVSLTGIERDGVILDAEGESGVIRINFQPYQQPYQEISNMTIRNGNAEKGGGISSYYSNFKLKNVALLNNSASWGGGIYSLFGSFRLENVTIANCSAEVGGGIYKNVSTEEAYIINSLLWNNGIEGISLGHIHEGFNIIYSDIEGGLGGITNSNYVNWLEGNINEDPLFFDPANGSYLLGEDSPCIDAGTAYYEYEGEVLIDLSEDEYYGTAPDMGAFEYGLVEADEFITQNSKLKIQNYPNPFNPETQITFNLPEAEHVNLSVYNLKGQLVKLLADEVLPTGNNSLIWDGKNETSRKVSSGIYLLRLKSNNETTTKKIMLIK